MNSAATDTLMRPSVKFTQSKTELPSRYATSAEVTAQTAQATAGLMRQMQEAALKLSHSNAFGNLTQGLMNNHLRFWTDLSQSLGVGFSQGQSLLMRQAEAVGSDVADATQANVRRARRAT